MAAQHTTASQAPFTATVTDNKKSSTSQNRKITKNVITKFVITFFVTIFAKRFDFIWKLPLYSEK